MLLKYFYDDRLAQASYMIGCPDAGTAMVIDASRNIEPYLQAAEQHELSITHVVETHIHADYTPGTRELAALTNATIGLSAEGTEDWQYIFPDDNVQLLHDGDVIQLGAVKIEVMHTPGHTPEHISFLVTDLAVGDQPVGAFTGDFLFVGDVGRPDLLEKAAHVVGTANTGAHQQYANIECFKDLPDHLQIWPGHGAGSACGKALGAVPSTTLGYEKLFNPAFNQADEETFVNWLLADQPEVPGYFAHMKWLNKRGAPLLRELPQAQHIREMPSDDIVPTDALFIDTRPPADFAKRYLPGTINMPISENNFTTYIGYYVDYDKPVFFIAYENDVMDVLEALFSIGIDNVPGYFTDEVLADASGTIKLLTPEEIYKSGMKILDIRSASEHASERIDGTMHIHMGEIPQRLGDIPRDEPLAIHCGGGIRSVIVTSILQKAGFDNIVNMSDGIDGWQKAGLPIVQS